MCSFSNIRPHVKEGHVIKLKIIVYAISLGCLDTCIQPFCIFLLVTFQRFANMVELELNRILWLNHPPDNPDSHRWREGSPRSSTRLSPAGLRTGKGLLSQLYEAHVEQATEESHGFPVSDGVAWRVTAGKYPLPR